MSKPKLYLDWCSHEAAKYAVEHWHYSRQMPCGKLIKIGVWENEGFIGSILFGRGASPQLKNQYGLTQMEVCELVRVALKCHENAVTRIVAIAIRLLKKQSPGLRLIASFADPEEGHIGGIYQGGNWIYTGKSAAVVQYFQNGKWRHHRTVFATDKNGRKVNPDRSIFQRRTVPGKHRYLYPLDDDMRKQILPLSKPYPKKQPELASQA